MKKIFMILIFIGAVLAASAQSTRQVRGAVVDKKNGNPLPGAKVEATGGAESTVTDADGTFTLEVSKWLKTLTATYPGMNKKKENIESSEIIFEMMPKQKMTWFVDVVGNVSYSTEVRPSLTTGGMGLMFGQIGKWGWYGRFSCDFHGPTTYERHNYRLDPGTNDEHYVYWDKENKIITDYSSSGSYYNGNYRENDKLYYDEEEKNLSPGFTIAVGGIKSIIPNLLYGFLGIGYSSTYFYDYELNNSFTANFVDADGIRRSAKDYIWGYEDKYKQRHNTKGPGLAFDGGFILRIKHVNVMLGYTPRVALPDSDFTHTFNLGLGYVF